MSDEKIREALEARRETKHEELIGRLRSYAKAEECAPEPETITTARRRFETIPAGPHVSFRFLGPILEVMVHWVDKTSFPCMAGCKLCPGPRQVSGYASILRGNQRTVFACGEAVADSLRGKALRGMLIDFHKSHNKGPTSIQVVEESSNLVLPEPEDLKAILMRRWKLDCWVDGEVPPEADEDGANILKFKRA